MNEKQDRSLTLCVHDYTMLVAKTENVRNRVESYAEEKSCEAVICRIDWR
jgi:hypothetical protein